MGLDRQPCPRACCALSIILLIGAAVPASANADQDVPVDLGGYQGDCGVAIRLDDSRLSVGWPMEGGEFGRMVLDLRPGRPLVESLGVAEDLSGRGARVLLKGLEPVTFLTVGTRQGAIGRPPEMSDFNEFFDSPAKRPYESFRSRLDLHRARVTGKMGRATIALGDLSAGSFKGELQLTFYAGSRLVHVEAVLRTEEDRRAIVYDSGLATESPSWRRFAWMDAEGRLQKEEVAADAADRPIAVRHRAIVAESDSGSVACFPPPHQFFFPRDLTDNLKSVWVGRGHRGLDDRPGFGVRQAETGGGSFVPWSNAPPGTEQRLGVFYLLSRGPAEDALRESLRYTHEDRFPDLPGFRTLTSHWHMALTEAAMREQAKGAGRTTPDLVRMFKEMNVDVVHLAEFHGDGHPADPGPLRLAEMEAMFAECRRLSDSELLVLPGEEANVYLGRFEPGRHPGHWVYLFPRPVYWTMRRAQGQPFVEEDPRLGPVYHVGDREDMIRLLRREHGLAWTAHARIKASSWAPDAYRDDDFFRADFWLGAAWKAMPADLSRPRLGDRVLDVFSDMDNWGGKKYVLGEVDVFKIDHTHELYGHMNVNYVRLDRLPKFDEGWPAILDALRLGQFFVTTGELLVPEYTVGGKSSGESLSLDAGKSPEVRATVEWTFPPRFAELVSGDGKKVYRERIDLGDAGPFGKRTLTLSPDLRGRKWVRFEVWDVAADGAFTQPVWLTTEGGEARP